MDDIISSTEQMLCITVIFSLGPNMKGYWKANMIVFKLKA